MVRIMRVQRCLLMLILMVIPVGGIITSIRISIIDEFELMSFCRANLVQTLRIKKILCLVKFPILT